jgi:PncC family amidohydrolase
MKKGANLMPKPSSVEIIHHHFILNHLTLSVVESCTGGALSARITQQPGCSAYYLGGIVSYCNQLKMNLLGVKEETLSSYGAVSGEVVAEMVEGILRLTGSDYAIAISGLAGPEGESQNPVGTMWGAVSKQGQKPHVWRFHVDGNRQGAIAATVDELLKMLVDFI